MANPTEQTTSQPVPVLPKLARVIGGKGFETGNEVKLTYMGEADGWKSFVVGELPTDGNTTPMRLVKLQFDHSYQPKDVITAIPIGELNNELMWAVNPRPPLLRVVPPSILAAPGEKGFIFPIIADPDNPMENLQAARLVRATSNDQRVISVNVDQYNNVSYSARAEGTANIYLQVTTGTGQDSVHLPVLVDSRPPRIRFTDTHRLKLNVWETLYVGSPKTYQFNVEASLNSPMFEYRVELISIDLQDEGWIETEIDQQRNTLTIYPKLPGQIMLRLLISNIEQPRFAELYLHITELYMNE